MFFSMTTCCMFRKHFCMVTQSIWTHQSNCSRHKAHHPGPSTSVPTFPLHIIPNVKRKKLACLPDRRRDLQQAVRLYRAIHPNKNGRYAMRDPSGAARDVLTRELQLLAAGPVGVSVEELRRYSPVKGYVL